MSKRSQRSRFNISKVFQSFDNKWYRFMDSKTSWRRFVSFQQTSIVWLSTDENGNISKAPDGSGLKPLKNRQETKIGFAIEKVLLQYPQLESEMADKFKTATIKKANDSAGEDDKKKVLTKDAHNQFEFTPEKQIERDTMHRELWDDPQGVKFKACIVQSKLAESLSVAELDAFSGFILDPKEVDRIMALKEAMFEEKENPKKDDKLELPVVPVNGEDAESTESV